MFLKTRDQVKGFAEGVWLYRADCCQHPQMNAYLAKAMLPTVPALHKFCSSS